MADIYHSLTIQSSPEEVFKAISTPAGLDNWWTKDSAGNNQLNEVYKLNFGPLYHWGAVVSKCVANENFELTMTNSDQDWKDTKVGFVLKPNDDFTKLSFYHTGWPVANEHYKTSSFCWAMYLRILKNYLENGELVPYEERDS